MKTTLFIISLSFCICNPLFSQKKEAAEADEDFKHKNYASALPRYLQLLDTFPDNGSLNYKAGACYLASRSLKPKALPFLEKAAANSPSHLTKAYPGEAEAPADVYLLLGDAYYLTYNFDKALRAYEQYEQLLTENKKPDEQAIQLTRTKRDMCRLVKELRPVMQLPIDSKNNKPCGDALTKGEFTSSLSPDKQHMIYTVKVPLEKISQAADAPYFENEQISKNDSSKILKRKNARRHLERDSVVYASTVGASFDGQVVLTYRNEGGDGNLYISRLFENKWTHPVKMKKVVNSAGWEPQECVSPDGNTLYFSSDRPGGYGGHDIYFCKKLPNGEWSKARNLGPDVNTAADEEAPFIHSDSQTLYFSSNRVLEGSYDIFASNNNGKQWSKPINVGFPINRDDQDIFQVDADKKIVYPAGQPAAEKFKVQETSDTTAARVIPDRESFMISFVSQQKSPLTVMKGVVKDENGKTPESTDIVITDNQSGEVLAKHYSDGGTGLYSFVLPPGRNLNITFELPGYLFHSENREVNKDNQYFEKNKAVQLKRLDEGAETQLNNVFFEKDNTAISAQSKTEIKKVYELMTSHPEIEIGIYNHIYSETNKRFYKRLSKQRAKAMGKSLVEMGIDKKRIHTKGYRHLLEEEKKEMPKKTGSKKRVPKPPKHKKTERPPVQEMKLKITDINQIDNKNKKRDGNN